jgi:hypothetical protein
LAEDQYYLTWSVHPRERGLFIAVISLGSPQLGDKNVKVLDVETVRSPAEARSWMKRQMKTKPWENGLDWQAMLAAVETKH